MDKILLLLSLVAGALGWSLAVAMTGSFRQLPSLPARERPFWWMAVAGTALVLLVTLPSHPPFAAGAPFGSGFVFGAVLLLACARARFRDKTHAPAGLYCGAVLATAVPLALAWAAGRDMPLFDLYGVASGQAFAGLLLSVASGERAVWGRAVQSGAMLGVATAVATALGLLHERISAGALPEASNVAWGAAALALAAVVAICTLLGELCTERAAGTAGLWRRVSQLLWNEEAPERAAGMLVAVAFALLLAAILALRGLQEPLLALVFSLGIVTGLLVLLICRDPDSAAGTAASPAPTPAVLSERRAQTHLVGTAVMLLAFTYAFAQLQGLGTAVLLMGVLLPVGFSPGARQLPALRIAGFGLVLCVFRLFVSQYGSELHGMTGTDNYALLGVLAGLLLPAFPAQLAREGENASPWRLIAAGVLALVAPALVLVVLGPAVVVPLLIGYAASCTLRPGAVSGLWPLAMALAALAAMGHLQHLADLDRESRIWFLLVASLVTAVVIAGCRVLARASRSTPASRPASAR